MNASNNNLTYHLTAVYLSQKVRLLLSTNSRAKRHEIFEREIEDELSDTPCLSLSRDIKGNTVHVAVYMIDKSSEC